MTNENELIELRLLLEAIYQKYGYDFRNYSENHLKRRIDQVLKKTKIKNISELQYNILYHKNTFNVLLKHLSINVTEMFRDPSFFKVVREDITSFLKSYPFIKVWVAGCASGEEAYSIAIILKECGLLEKSLIYATDMNELVLSNARVGKFDKRLIDQYHHNYLDAGCIYDLHQYFIEKDNDFYIKDDLKKRIIFANHNLVTDGVFGEMNFIICRNVFIYFDQTLQNRVLKLFVDSLGTGGFLGLGSKEDIRYSAMYHLFNIVNKKEKLYQKKYI